jgi:hypothetical protein
MDEGVPPKESASCTSALRGERSEESDRIDVSVVIDTKAIMEVTLIFQCGCRDVAILKVI